MIDPATGATLTGSSTVSTVPAVGTYTSVFPLHYTMGTGATNCRRLPVSTPPSGVDISSSSRQHDAIMLQQRQLAGVSGEDVTVSFLNPLAPQTFTAVVTIACDNTTPSQQSFAITLSRQQVAMPLSIQASYNGQTSSSGALVNGALLALPTSGAVQRTVQLAWTIPTTSTGCSVYREDTDRGNTPGNGPLAPVNPSSVQGSDPYSFTGTAVSGSGMNANFVISFSAADLVFPNPSTTQMRYAVYCTSTPADYASVDIYFSRHYVPGSTTTQNGCLGGVSTKPYPTAVAAPVSVAPSTLRTFADVPQNQSRIFAAQAPAQQMVAVDLSTYQPPVTTITQDPPPVITASYPVVTPDPCGSNGGGSNPDPTPTAGLIVNPTPYAQIQTNPWDYAVGSRRWSE